MEILQESFEQDSKAANLQISELITKLEEVTQGLAVTQLSLATKEKELSALKNDYEELEELREMKKVVMVISYLILQNGFIPSIL